ncbi:MAG: Xaa-Pro aminopeptidase [Candidatus Saccharimonadales bacterium]
MKTHFNAAFFIGNRQQLRSLYRGDGPIIMTANGLLQRNADSSFLFRQDSNFWYLTGIQIPDVVLVMDQDRDYLIVSDRDDNRSAFDGDIDTDDIKRRSGIDIVYGDREGWKSIGKRLKNVSCIGALKAPDSFIESIGLYTNPARRRVVERVQSYNDAVSITDIRSALVHLRSIKQPEELHALQDAIDITAQAFQIVSADRFYDYHHEYEIEANITKCFRSQNAQHAYQPIIASGIHACTLHYIDNDAGINHKGSLLIDAGAEVEGYAADITRSYSLGNNLRYMKFHEAVSEVQDYAISLLRPGVLIHEYEAKIESYIGEKLRELGLIKKITSQNVRKFYPHATSHFLGLDVHDVGDYERALEPGMVLTVEPGIYSNEDSIGIRIEDDVLITPTGTQILSGALPRNAY